MSDSNIQTDQDQEDVLAKPPAEFDQETFNAVSNLVHRLSIELDELKTKKKEFKEQLDAIQLNDDKYNELEENAKKASEAFKARKKELQNRPDTQAVQAKIKETSEEMRDIEESLSNNLLSYYQMTGARVFDTPTGDEREFTLKARLKPAKFS